MEMEIPSEYSLSKNYWAGEGYERFQQKNGTNIFNHRFGWNKIWIFKTKYCIFVVHQSTLSLFPVFWLLAICWHLSDYTPRKPEKGHKRRRTKYLYRPPIWDYHPGNDHISHLGISPTKIMDFNVCRLVGDSHMEVPWRVVFQALSWGFAKNLIRSRCIIYSCSWKPLFLTLTDSSV